MQSATTDTEHAGNPESRKFVDFRSATRVQAELLGASAALRPVCVPCSAAWAKEHALPAVVPVERALIMRETPGRGYLAVVHCHGAVAIIAFGTETPSDNKIRSTRAFSEAA